MFNNIIHMIRKVTFSKIYISFFLILISTQEEVSIISNEGVVEVITKF